jgi:hypothetical protein
VLVRPNDMHDYLLSLNLALNIYIFSISWGFMENWRQLEAKSNLVKCLAPFN